MIDTTIPEVREKLEELKATTGLSEDEILRSVENSKTRYVRFTRGEYKGQVGYYYFIPMYHYNLNDFMDFCLNPYARDIYLPDGETVVVTMGWDRSFDHITEEEYLKECKEQSND